MYEIELICQVRVTVVCLMYESSVCLGQMCCIGVPDMAVLVTEVGHRYISQVAIMMTLQC